MGARGRPVSANWEEILPELINLRDQGATYGDLADYVEAKYGNPVSYQTVRTRLKSAGAQDKPKKQKEDKKPLKRGENVEGEVRDFMQANPWASVPEIAEGLNLPIDTTIKARDRVINSTPGYTIIPPRPRRETYSETEMLDALVDAMEATGCTENNPLSRQIYAEWRENLPADERKLFPSPLAYRRKYGSWGEALEAAGLPRNERKREYEGIEKPDAILWLAHFLRDLRTSHPIMVEATAPMYRAWLRTHQEAPSEELLRIKGNWGELLIEAAKLEMQGGELPPPRAVWTGGRRKRERPLFSSPAGN